MSVARIREAMQDAGTPTRDGDALLYLGHDAAGVELEIVAVPDSHDPDGLAVIHAMPTHYRRNR